MDAKLTCNVRWIKVNETVPYVFFDSKDVLLALHKALEAGGDVSLVLSHLEETLDNAEMSPDKNS